MERGSGGGLPEQRDCPGREPAAAIISRAGPRVRNAFRPVGHATWQTGEEKPGWPVQPGQVMLFEDYNVARAVKHPVTKPGDVPATNIYSCRPMPGTAAGLPTASQR